MKARQAELPSEQRIAFRIGIHIGEVVEDGEQLHGDGINIAVRIESIAPRQGAFAFQMPSTTSSNTNSLYNTKT